MLGPFSTASCKATETTTAKNGSDSTLVLADQMTKEDMLLELKEFSSSVTKLLGLLAKAILDFTKKAERVNEILQVLKNVKPDTVAPDFWMSLNDTRRDMMQNFMSVMFNQ